VNEVWNRGGAKKWIWAGRLQSGNPPWCLGKVLEGFPTAAAVSF
jgi:hypothetical protein